MGWARGDSASGSCPARSEGGIQRAIQTYHQRAPRAKQDTTTGRECFRGGSERHRTHGQQEAASNTGHPPGWKGGPSRKRERVPKKRISEALRKLISRPTSSFSFFSTLLGPSGPSLAGGLVESGSNSGSLVCSAARRQLRGPKAAARRQSCLRAWRRQQSGAVR